MRRSIRVSVSALLIAIVLAPLAASAPDDAPEPKTLRVHLEAKLEQVRLQLINAGARMRGGAISMGGSPEGEPVSPAYVCCAQNIEQLQRQLTEMAAIWRELKSCYRSEGLAEAEIQANFMREDAGSLIRGLEVFTSADEGAAAGGFAAMSRAFFQLEASFDKLPECGEPVVRQ